MRSALTVISLAIAIALAAPGAAVGGPIRYPVESRDRLVIHATGDVMTSPGFIPPFRTGDFTTAWTGVDGIFLRDDLTIVNLECDPSDRGTLLSDKPYSFRCPPEWFASATALMLQGSSSASKKGRKSNILRSMRA